MMPLGPVLPRYQSADLYALKGKWLEMMAKVGLHGCFGCMQQGHGWRKDFSECKTGKCAICQVPYTDQQKGHATADCPCFPQSPEDLADIRKVQGTF